MMIVMLSFPGCCASRKYWQILIYGKELVCNDKTGALLIVFPLQASLQWGSAPLDPLKYNTFGCFSNGT